MICVSQKFEGTLKRKFLITDSEKTYFRSSFKQSIDTKVI